MPFADVLATFPFGWLWLFLYGVILLRAGGTYGLGVLIANRAGTFPRIRKLMSSRKFARARSLLDRYGMPVIVVSFMLIGIQTVVHLAAGTSGMRFVRYLPGLLLGGAVWALIYSTVGFVGFAAIAAAYQRAPGMTLAVSVLIILTIIGTVWFNRRAHRKTQTGADLSI